MNIDPLIRTALQHFQAGEHQSAEDLCRRILKKQPQDADAWHILGLIARDAKKNEQALGMIGNAIAINPGAAIFRRSCRTYHPRGTGLYHRVQPSLRTGKYRLHYTCREIFKRNNFQIRLSYFKEQRRTKSHGENKSPADITGHSPGGG